MEAAFESENGVLDVRSGFSGGSYENPTYEIVKSGMTDHYETIEIHYDPSIISYDKLLSIFWANIDPTDTTGQYHSKGSQYRTVIFYKNE